jgi:hypothetical protein
MGIQYTAPRVFKAWQAASAPKVVTQEDIAQTSKEMAPPIFEDMPNDNVTRDDSLLNRA